MHKLALITAALAALSLPALAQDAPAATAAMADQSGTALGTLTLTEMDGGIHITGELTGVPNGEHGIHIHAVGTCDAAAKFESAGPHFERGDNKHGTMNPDGPHAGDLENVVADDDGKAVVDLHNEKVATLAELMDTDGTAIVIHEKADDYTTDPSGNSGDRFACGVVETNG
jgi:superoxide dismutase, Cu-Zn family